MTPILDPSLPQYSRKDPKADNYTITTSNSSTAAKSHRKTNYRGSKNKKEEIDNRKSKREGKNNREERDSKNRERKESKTKESIANKNNKIKGDNNNTANFKNVKKDKVTHKNKKEGIILNYPYLQKKMANLATNAVEGFANVKIANVDTDTFDSYLLLSITIIQ